MNAKLTNVQKAKIAEALIDAAADIVETMNDSDSDRHQSLRGIDRDAVALQLSTWLKHLPGNYWNNALPQ